MTTSMHIGLAGRFTLEVFRPDGSRRVRREFDNLILDSGLNQVGSGGIVSRARVGTGSTAPAVGQSALVNQVAATSSVTSSTNGYDSVGNLYGWARRTFRFAAGVAAGVLAEVGVGWADTGNTLWSRALILDDEGAPTTITVLGDEVLDVTYELRLYRPTDDASYSVDISGTTHAVVMRAASMSNWGNAATYFMQSGLGTSNFLGAGAASQQAYGPGTLGPVTAGPGGSSIGTGTVSFDGSYSNNSHERKFTATWGITAGSGDIGNVAWNTHGGYFKNSFDPVIAKTSANELKLNFTVSWARKTL